MKNDENHKTDEGCPTFQVFNQLAKEDECNIEDVNDNLPRFEQDDYARVIEEGADHFEPPLVIKATDSDGPNQV